MPDVGPLTEYESWMPDFMKGLAEGIEKSRSMVEKAIGRVSSDLVLNPEMGNLKNGVYGNNSGNGGSNSQNNSQNGSNINDTEDESYIFNKIGFKCIKFLNIFIFNKRRIIYIIKPIIR